MQGIPVIPDISADGNMSGTGQPAFLPVLLVIQDTMSSHEEDLKDRIFEYKMEKARSDSQKQAGLINERANELKESAKKKEGLINALVQENNNGSISGEQFTLMLQETNKSIFKISQSSNKLKENVKSLMDKNKNLTIPDLTPILLNLEGTASFAQNLSKSANDKIIVKLDKDKEEKDKDKADKVKPDKKDDKLNVTLANLSDYNLSVKLNLLRKYSTLEYLQPNVSDQG
ncbi:hypothetical protein CUJ83_01125 [Methanocella sp. CWC-04]|uniref:Uncharacterized protein n=2 Tax=Methanooceanicella nereidis TaxID=2052831 RepID=A0AAP2R9X2_9EURY|nr:hypothetical protein [Methanocella sp. CWC-04]